MTNHNKKLRLDSEQAEVVLRKKAEGILRDQAFFSLEKVKEMSPEEIQRVLHNLQLHQIELEMQNVELRRAQAELDDARIRYFELYDLAPVGYCTLDKAGLILTANLTAATMLGVQRTELMNSPISHYILKEDQDIFYLQCQQLFKTGEPQGYELRMVASGGASTWVRLEVNMTQNNLGAPEYRMALIDITERKLAEEESKQLEARLMQAYKMEAIGTLAGGIAHDFNNILCAILGYVELASKITPATSPAAQFLDKALEGVQRATMLVGQILAFSRQKDTKRVPLQVAPIINEAIKLLRPLLPSTIKITRQIQEDSCSILADPTQIHQILMNLCTNAFHAMEMTGGTLTITLQDIEIDSNDQEEPPSALSRRFVKLTIGDTGPGISTQVRDKIFEPYFTTKTVGKGSGMGLAIVHGIVKNYDGFITVDSEKGAGSKFHIYLPAVSQVEAAKDVKEADKLIPGGNERILLIDDEELVADMGRSMLEHLGYEVTVFTNSLEAFSVFQQNRSAFDMVITDQTMPAMTGFDLAQRMLAIRPGLPIIICTGYSSTLSEESAQAIGIRGFTMKPLAIKNISTLIRKVFDDNNYVKFS